MGVVSSLVSEEVTVTAAQAFFSLLSIPADIWGAWVLRGPQAPQQGQSTIFGSDVSCVMLPVNGVILKRRKHSHVSNFFTSHLNNFSKVQNSSFRGRWWHLTSPSLRGFGPFLANSEITFILYLTAGCNLTWGSVWVLLYDCESTSLLATGAFPEMHVLNFYDQHISINITISKCFGSSYTLHFPL